MAPSKMFRYYVIGYCVIIVLMTVLNVTIYITAQNSLIQNALDISYAELEKCTDEIDNMVAAAKSISGQLAKSDALRDVSLTKGKPSGHVAYGYLMGLNAVKSIMPDDSPFDGMILYYTNCGLVVTHSTVYSDQHKFVQQCLPSVSLNRWDTFRSASYFNNNITSLDDKMIISNTVIFSKQGSVVSRAIASFYIASDKIGSAILSSLNNYFGSGYYVILSDEDQIITTNYAPFDAEFAIQSIARTQGGHPTAIVKIDGVDTLVAAYLSPTGSTIRYIIGIPMSAILRRISRINTLMLITFAVMIVLTFATALLLSRRNTEKVRAISSLLSPGLSYDASTDEMKIIISQIKNLEGKRAKYISTVQRQQILLRSTFFHRLSQGEFLNDMQIDHFMNESGLSISAEAYCAGILVLPEQGLLFSADSRTVYVNPVDEKTYSLLFLLDKCDMEEAASKAWKMIGELDSQAQIYLGPAFSSLTDAPYSYKKAQISARNSSKGEGVVYESPVLAAQASFPYPIDLEEKLMAFVRSGGKEEAALLLDGLKKRTAESSWLDTAAYLKTTALRLLSEAKASGLCTNEEKARSLHELLCRGDVSFDQIRQALLELAEAKRDTMNRISDELALKIVEIINARLSDATLGLCSLAQETGYSETYISVFFKKKTGENVSAYIEKLRMREASRLLSDTDTTIQDIASQCGYTSDQSFRRAFKRVTGLAPTQLRT